MPNWFEQLTKQGLRSRFEQMSTIRWVGEPFEPRLIDREPADAAVLIPLVERKQGFQVMLTLRTAHLSDHAGQVSFPGGRCEETDITPIETALRETEEETGLHRQHVEVLGCMPIYQTGTNFLVTPVVGIVQPDFDLNPQAFEVAEVFEVPLTFLMNPVNHKQHVVQTAFGPRSFYAMPYDVGQTGKSYFIWGATAAMLRNLYHFLNPEA